MQGFKQFEKRIEAKLESSMAGVISVADFDEVKTKIDLVESRLASKSDLTWKKQGALTQQFAQC